MADSPLKAQIETNVTKPDTVSADGVSAKAIPITSQIEADRYLASQVAATKPHRGLLFARVKTPSADGS